MLIRFIVDGVERGEYLMSIYDTSLQHARHSMKGTAFIFWLSVMAMAFCIENESHLIWTGRGAMVSSICIAEGEHSQGNALVW
jgi:hypothetical protein